MLSNIAIAVFARMDSRRLPGKALRSIAGRPMLDHVLDRLGGVGDAGTLVVATTDRAIDEPLVERAREKGVRVFRGNDNDVLGRAHACAEDVGAEHLVRISGDSPFIDAAIVRAAIERHMAENPDITTNVFPSRARPPGQSVEVFSVAALTRLDSAARTASDREHVSSYAYANADDYRIVTFETAAGPLPDTRLVVDDADDLARAHWLAEALGDALATADADTIAALACDWTPQRVTADG